MTVHDFETLNPQNEVESPLAVLRQRFPWADLHDSLAEAPGWHGLVCQMLQEIGGVFGKDLASELSFLAVSVYPEKSQPLTCYLYNSFTSGDRGRHCKDILEYRIYPAVKRTCHQCGARITESAHSEEGLPLCENHRAASRDSQEDPLPANPPRAPGTLVTIFDDLDNPDGNQSPEQEAPEVPEPIFAQLYDVDEVAPLERFSDNADKIAQERIRALAKEMVKLGGKRAFSPVPKDIRALMADLRGRFPNFAHVVDWIEGHLILGSLNGRIIIPPLMLTGPAGVGKTYLAKTLAKVLGTSYLEVHFETAQSSSTLSGSSEFWGNTQQGELFNTLVRGRYFNPVVVIDELDKSGGVAHYDPMSSLYQLLEPESAKQFRDESMKRVSLNASGVIWIMTANSANRIPAPILSRLTVMPVASPSFEQNKVIAQQVYESVLETRVLSDHFEKALSTEVAACLATRSPREMKVIIASALAQAAQSGRRILAPEDIAPAIPEKRIGFIH